MTRGIDLKYYRLIAIIITGNAVLLLPGERCLSAAIIMPTTIA